MAITLLDYTSAATGTMGYATFTLTGMTTEMTTTTGTTVITSYADTTTGQLWYTAGDKWIQAPAYPVAHPYVARPRRAAPDPDAAARQARFAAELRERDRARSLAAATARATARALLEDWLTPAQRATLDRGHIDVTGSAGGRYRIRTGGGQAGNVDLLDARGRVLLSYCAHPGARVPHEDGFLAQLLHLETDEPGFVAVANIDRDYRPRLLAAA
jgi:hypothetical protein